MNTNYPKNINIQMHRLQNADTVIQDYQVTGSTSEAKTVSSLSFSELKEMRNRILSKDKCSETDLEKLVIINELLGDEAMNFDKLKGWQWLVIGIAGGFLLHGHLMSYQQIPTAGNAPAVYNIQNNPFSKN